MTTEQLMAEETLRQTNDLLKQVQALRQANALLKAPTAKGTTAAHKAWETRRADPTFDAKASARKAVETRKLRQEAAAAAKELAKKPRVILDANGNIHWNN